MSVVEGTLTGTLTMATPLLLGALGENIVERAGVVNVGLEGMMLLGAFAATMGARQSGNPYLGVAVAAGIGVLTALLFAAFAIKLTANQVVIGVVMNLLALGVTGTAYRALFGTTGSFVETAALPRLLWDQTLLTPLALLAVPAVWWGLFRTRLGLELRACGEQPVAAEAAGVNVARLRTAALAFGGAMAGIAGAFLSVGETNTFKEDMTAGRGFIALAIVTAGRWNPYGCLAAALIFGFADALQIRWQALGWNLPYQLFLALPYIVTLAILALGGRASQAPAALGQPYRRA
ncbi:MAG TPA: ABC transporter permease [Chthonomonadaceae bacterium]|nr:ABC transporter permease [Chthonomonadaceae bacterium]